MTHEQAQKQEMAERYVRHQLAPAERQAFQEHFFACEECFEEVQTVARFVAGVRQAARRGLLGEAEPELQKAWWADLFSPMLLLAASGALAITLGAAWLFSRSNSAPSTQIAHEQQPTPSMNPTTSPTVTATETPATTAPTPAPTLKREDQRELLAQNQPPEDKPGKTPSFLLESSRDVSPGSNQLTLPANATQALLRLEIEPGSGYANVQCQVYDSARRPVTSASGKPSPRGVVAMPIAASPLQTGKYLVKCHGIKDGQRLLVGEYDLNVRRP